MKEFLFLACVLMLGWTNSAFCANLQSQVSLLQYEVNKLDIVKDKEEAELLKPVIEANINYLTSSIRLKIKKYEANLEKIKKQIQNCNTYFEDDEGSGKILVEKYWKKFYSTQKKIASLNDLLFVIDQLKFKLID